MLYENGEFERIRPHLTPLECGIIFDGIPEGAISRKVGLIWGIPVKLTRCPWVDLSKPDYVDYHDREWGVPVHDDLLLFEFLVLEGAQAGLSWYTVLRKRENYRAAFDDFDPQMVAKYDEDRVALLLGNLE